MSDPAGKQWLRILAAGSLRAFVLLLLLLGRQEVRGAGPLYITELMADNGSVLRDEDGDYSDWIEIHNPGNSVQSLDGWSVTDDVREPAKWRFPAGIQVPPSGFLVVFASGKDRTNGMQLHTNFRLSAEGEYLGLIDPLGGPSSEFTPSYPPQRDDISFGRDAADPELLLFYPVASPGSPNLTGGPGFAPEVQFSKESGTFPAFESLTLQLSTPHGGGTIYYTFATNAPGTNAFRYTAPIVISNSTIVRARAFEANLLPGPISSRTYLALGADLQHFSSDLPLMILHNFGQGPVLATGEEQYVAMQAFEPRLSSAALGRRSSLTNAPTQAERGVFHVRGFLTAVTSTNGKSSFLLETQDEGGGNKNVALLGLPEESDWVLYAPNVYDPAMFQNPLAHHLFRELGSYSSRTRFFEMFLKDNAGEAGPITMADYYGVFVLEERIKRDQNRVDVEQLQPEHRSPPEITGGYILSIDETNDTAPLVAGGAILNFEYPNGFEMNGIFRVHQHQYLKNYFDEFNAVLHGPSWTDPLVGYAAFIDVDSWIDYHLHTVVVFSPDTLRLSTYLHKPRSQRLKLGPGWDYDRSQGSADMRDFNPLVWRSSQGADYFNEQPWWGRLFQDPDFWQRWIDRYQELRDGALSTNAIFGKIDEFTSELREAQQREQQRWRILPRSGVTKSGGFVYDFGSPPAFDNEIRFKKHWYSSRLGFMDTQFLARPNLTSSGGLVQSGFPVAVLPAREPGSSVVCTLDGSDPRLPGGGISPTAISNLGPIVLNVTNNLRIVARNFNPDHQNLTGPGNPQLSSPWSGSVAATFYTQLPPLRVTEIMFHPQPPLGFEQYDDEDFEFVEVKNIGSEPLKLRGFTIGGGIEFTFPDRMLPPGGHGVIVANSNAFHARYPGTINVLGVFGRRLSNAGDRLVLSGPMKEPVLEFEYQDDWFPIADGVAFSLVHKDANGDPKGWNARSSWRASALPGGSPGADDPSPAHFPKVVINEVWTHEDAVEVRNLSDAPSDISGWFLTDDFRDPKKYAFPPDTVLGPGEFRVISGTTLGFALSASGEEIHLFSANEGTLTGYAHGFDFGAIEGGLSFGRFVNSSGSEQLPIQSASTPGLPNAGPRIGPVVISEIHYRPPDHVFGTSVFDNDDDEYLELYNITDQQVDLCDGQNATNEWKLTDAVSFEFPPGSLVGARGFALVVGFDPRNPGLLKSFRERYAVPETTSIYGPFEGKLDNSSDRVELRRPIPPDPIFSDPSPYSLVERINYSDDPPWPGAADGLGRSLQRISASSYGNDSANWAAAPPSPGRLLATTQSPVIDNQPTNVTTKLGSTAQFNVSAQGSGPFYFQWRFNERAIPGATDSVLELQHVQPSGAGEYDVVVMNAANSATSSKASLTVLVPPEIAQQPEAQIVEPGGIAYFTVLAYGSPPVSYQWRRNGDSVPGETRPVLTIPNASAADSGLYDVVLSNPAGSVVSSNALLAMKVAPTLIAPEPPIHLTATVGDVITLAAELHGTFPLWVRWRVFRPVGSQILSTETLPPPGPLPMMVTQAISSITINVQSNSGGAYAAIVTNVALNTQTAFTNAFLTVLADADRDLLPDDYENSNGLDANDHHDAVQDLDGDGVTNYAEYVGGTDPRDPNSYLRLDPVDVGLPIALQFGAVSNRSYTLQYTESLAPASWLPLAHVMARNTNSVQTIIDHSNSANNRYYRVATPVIR